MDTEWMKDYFDKLRSEDADSTARVGALLVCIECQRQGTIGYLPAYIQSQDENTLDPAEYGLTAEQQQSAHLDLGRFTKREIRRAYLYLLEDAALPKIYLAPERSFEVGIRFYRDEAAGTCPICEDHYRPTFGPELFLVDGWHHVCEKCAREHAPEMLAGYYASRLSFFSSQLAAGERGDRDAPHAFQSKEGQDEFRGHLYWLTERLKECIEDALPPSMKKEAEEHESDRNPSPSKRRHGQRYDGRHKEE